MENTATTERNVERHNAAHDSMSVSQQRSPGRNIDGFFRSRATTIPRMSDQPAINNSVATIAAYKSSIPSAPEIRDVAATHAVLKPKKHSATRSINHTRAHTPQASPTRTITVKHSASPTQSLSVHRSEPNHVHHHAAQHSQTLRRDTVPAPITSTHNTLRPNSALQHKVPGIIEIKQSAETIDSDRLARASTAPKSPLVARHAATAPTLLPTFVPVAVQPSPTPTPAAPPVVPPPIPGNDGVPPAPAPIPDNKPTDIFEHALANANHYVDVRAHKEAYRKKARTHVATMLFGSLVLIIAASFVAYQNSPALQLRVASARTGVSGHIPNFAAAGFTFNGLRADSDRLIFGFKGNKGTYELTQTTTNFNDADMIQAIGATNANGTPIYQVVMAGNTVVYRFNNTNATWVSNGEWYTVSGSNALSNQQVETLVQHV